MVLKTVLLDFEIPENKARYEVQISLEKTKNIFSRLPYAVTCVGWSEALESCELSFDNICLSKLSRKIVTLKRSLFINSFLSGRALWFLTLVTF